MRAVLGSLVALFTSAFVLTIGHGLAGIVVQLRATVLGFSPLEIGFTGAAYYGGFVAGCFAGPAFIARVGHVRMFSVLGGALVAVLLALHMSTTLPAWLLLRAASGVLMAGQFMVIETWLNARAGLQTRGRVLAVYMLVTLGGNTLGQLGVNLAPVEGERLFMYAAILVALGIAPLGLSVGEVPGPLQSTRVRLGLLWRCAPLAFVGSVVSGFVTGASGALNAVFARGVGLDVFHVSVYTSAVIAGGAALQYPVGRLTDRMDRRVALGITFVGVAALSLASVLVLRTALGLLPVVGFLWGGVAQAIYPTALAHANDRAPEGEYVGVGSAVLVMWGVGAVLGPPAASACMRLLGSEGFFVWALASCAMALPLVAAQWRQGAAPGRAVLGNPRGAA